MPNERHRLPLVREVGSETGGGCGTGGCSNCSQTACGDRRRGRIAALVIGGLIFVAVLPMWLMMPGPDAEAPRSMPPAVAPTPPPPVRIPAATQTAGDNRAVVTGGPPMICSAWPMPHPPRGPCENCHTVVDCPLAGEAQRPPPSIVPTITRNSLLPHAFAGACMHCHVILDEGPTPVNRDNANALPLAEWERSLVSAGQQVVGPSEITRLNAPVLGHGTILAHSYWGVCSNCHRVVDFGFGRRGATMDEALARAQTPLLSSNLEPQQIAQATTGDTGVGIKVVAMWGFGIIALVMFLLAMVYIALKIYVQSQPKAEQRALRKKLHLKKWFRVHEWSSMAFGAAVVLHWACSDLGSALLHVSLGLVLLLTLSGLLQRYKLPVISSSKHMRWLHTQRFLSVLLIITTLLGHLAVALLP